MEEVYAGIRSDYGEAYPERAGFAVRMVPLREQLTANARTVLVVLLGASIRGVGGTELIPGPVGANCSFYPGVLLQDPASP